MTNGSGARSNDVKQTAKSRRHRKVLYLLFLLVVIWPPFAWLAARGLIVHEYIPRADALVVLGGSSTYKERTQQAAQVFREGRAAKIILTNDGLQGGWSTEEQRNPFFVERASEELQRAGVPLDKIEILPQIVSSTQEEARLITEYAGSHGLHSLIIVTSAYHSRRAMWTMRRSFDGSGVTLGGEPAPAGQQTPSPFFWWLRPRGWRMVAGEYIKLVYYRLKY